MRLQSAIFHLDDVLLDGAQAREGADKVLSILKMEGVWMYAISAKSRSEANDALQKAGLADYFRGILTEGEAQCSVHSETMLEKAMRRLHSTVVDTVVFAGRLTDIETARNAHFRAVAVGGAAEGEEWEKMCTLAEYELPTYEDWFRQE